MRKKLPKSSLIYFLLLLIAISACTASKDPFDPPDFTPTEVPADWITVGAKVQHVEVSAVASEKVPARSITLPETQTLSLLKALPDGGCLAVSQLSMDRNDQNGNPMVCLQAIRLRRMDRHSSPDGTANPPATLYFIPLDG